jgi:hypothetical protein
LPPIDGDLDGYFPPADCNDSDPLVHPGAAEIPYNGKDDDCNPSTRDDDLDMDGYLLATDCNDANPLVNPGMTEIQGNGIDDDCNPVTPDDPPPAAPTGLTAATVPDTTTVLLLHFGEGTGSTTVDSSPNGATAILGDLGTGDAQEPAWATGIFGAALSFDGVDDYVRIADSPALELPGSLTVEFFARQNLPFTHEYTVINKGLTDQHNYLVSIQTDGRIRFFWELFDGTDRTTLSTTALPDTNWHHIACVFDAAAGENRIYIDGILDVVEPKSGLPVVSTDDLFIGAQDQSGNAGYMGSLDEIRVSATARYHGNFVPPQAPFTTVQLHLDWANNTEADLMGYNVYRATSPSGPFSLLNGTFILIPSDFLDVNSPVSTLFYLVAAVDFSGNVSIPAQLTWNLPAPEDAPSPTYPGSGGANRPPPGTVSSPRPANPHARE